MKNMTLIAIAKAIDGQLYINGRKFEITDPAADCGSGFFEDLSAVEASSVIIDSRKAEKNCIFVATVGDRVDGHSFIGQVFEKGALGVICEKKPELIPEDCICRHNDSGSNTPEDNSNHSSAPSAGRTDTCYPYILVHNSFIALKKLAKYYREQMSQVKCIGIVGSVGKTSTKELVASVLSQSFKVHKTEGNFNNEVGVPLTVLGIRDEHEAAVIEMGISDFGEMSRLADIVKPNGVVMTNIGPCHLEKLIDLDGVLKAKTECIPFISRDGFLIINNDDCHLSSISDAGGRKIISYGSNADISVISSESHGLEGTRFQMSATAVSDENISAFVPLPGFHMVQNALAATAAGIELGMNLKDIVNGIAAVKPTSGRSNLIHTEKYLIVDDCYNANPKSMKAAIDLMQNALGRKCAILGDMFELGENENSLHAEVGEYAATHGIELLICIGRLSKNMADAYNRVSADSCLYFENLENFLKELKQNNIPFKKNDTILIKASHGMKFSEILSNL